MRHGVKGRSLGRKTNQKRALMKSLIRSLVLHERISTTEAKAKELQPMIEKLVSRARVNSVANQRLVRGRVGCSEATAKLFKTIAPRYEKRTGGYTRIVKRSATASDGRKLAYIAFV